MSIGKLVAGSVLAMGLVVGAASGVLAAGGHSHGGTGPKIELVLNKGAKWQTDAMLRRGMTDLRNDMAAALPQIHRGTLTAGDFAALAGKVDQHIQFITENCKLTPEADEQLHVVLASILDGVDDMKGAGHQEDGAVKIVQALALYPKYFDHQGWKPLSE